MCVAWTTPAPFPRATHLVTLRCGSAVAEVLSRRARGEQGPDQPPGIRMLRSQGRLDAPVRIAYRLAEGYAARGTFSRDSSEMTAWPPVILFGETWVTMPLAGLVAVWLLAAGNAGRAVLWAVMYGAAVALIVAGKFAFQFGGWAFPWLKFYNISGHAMQSSATYPVLLALIGSIAGERWARYGFVSGLLLALAVAIGLWVGNHHTVWEIILGAGVGLVVAGFHARPPAPLHARRGRQAVALVALCMVLGLQGGVPKVIRYAKTKLWYRSERLLGPPLQYHRYICSDSLTGQRTVIVVRKDMDDRQKSARPGRCGPPGDTSVASCKGALCGKGAVRASIAHGRPE